MGLSREVDGSCKTTSFGIKNKQYENMKIQSVSDIITNSSSEVFVKYDSQSVNHFKDTIQKLLNAFNVSEQIDDVIKIEYVWRGSKEDAIEDWQDAQWQYTHKFTETTPSDEELMKFRLERNDNSFKCGESAGIATAIKIIPVKPMYKYIADLIQELVVPFESVELYC